MKNLKFFNVILKRFYHFCVSLLIFTSFFINVGSFSGFWKDLEIQDGGPIWPTFKNHDVIPASCVVINS